MRLWLMTIGGGVLLASVVACAHREPRPVPVISTPPLAANTTPDSGEYELDQRWRLFCDLLVPSDGGSIVVPDGLGTVACQNHIVTVSPGDGGPPRIWKVKPLWPQFEVFEEYMRACRALGWDIGLEGVIDDCDVICVNRELALITALDGGACGYGETWMREQADPKNRVGDFAPFGKPWDQGPAPGPRP